MKKIILTTIISSILTFNIQAESYKMNVDKKHYENRVVIKPAPDENGNTPVYENPFTEQGFFKVDYLSSDDNLVTLDTTTGLEWLNLTVTNGRSVNDVLSDPTFAGWRLPTKSEVLHILRDVPNLQNMNYTSGYTSIPSADAEKAMEWVGLFGLNIGSYMKETSPTYATFAGVSKYGSTTYVYFDRNSYNPNTPISYYGYSMGVFLVSEGGLSYSSKENPAINIPISN